MGFTFVAVQAASYAEIAPADNGRASAIFSTQRQMSVSIGMALMATVLAELHDARPRRRPIPQRALRGYHWTFALAPAWRWSSALLAIAACIRDEDAAATMLADAAPRRPVAAIVDG